MISCCYAFVQRNYIQMMHTTDAQCDRKVFFDDNLFFYILILSQVGDCESTPTYSSCDDVLMKFRARL